MEQEQYHLTKGKTTGDAAVFIYADAIDRIENYIKGFYKWIKKDDNADVHIKPEDFEEVDKLIRKYLYTYQKNQPKTKKFLERIFKKYENGNVQISLAALRVIEFMDDELYNILIGKTHNDELLHAHALIKYDYKVTEQRSFTSMGTLSAFGSKGSGYDYQIHTQTVKTLTFHELHKLITEK